ncbi:cysteine--tRNA ligase [Thiohalophilus thiocyanatoxydans]|uniref:Cysteine--tRNA ligase n=1 Tax=Thiohalophilus thiocyanatoxydans TaxID=381308 RepID=A0A4R8ISA0_9GAMM|nr:cysteine--tRNA ligase [Thiohalophilus thiocyanatoxydans]TDY00053.1 cysteinyl-tRNA synthetase [Thiohalophilus thiocyanatoxydans]
MLQIHNNLSKRKEPFRPIDPANVRMYVCGMTVYDMCHIGHARVLVVFDVVYRYLCEVFGSDHVTYVRNITDIDDKIIQRARENDEGIDSLTGRYIDEMNRDAEALGVLHPNQEPRATGHMQQIIDMIGTLVEKGYAYAADNGDVYYDVSHFEHYGRLSGKHIEDLRAGERIAVDEAKQDPLDFVLWKAAKPEEPAWDSPWGRGRPGWHIECSAMSTHCLGHHFDIHGGGLDLQFPHHENEIAQSEAATGETFVNVWMHNGFVRVDEEKMSKSLGNFFTIRDVLQQYAPEVVRYFILSSHYRSPLNYSDQHLDNAKAALTTLYTALRGFEDVAPAISADMTCVERFRAAMDDDFNTPEAQVVLFELAHEINKQTDPAAARQTAATLKYLGALLGLLQQSPEAFLQGEGAGEGPDSEAIEALIRQRTDARANKDWAESDRIRDLLREQGVILEDGPGGTTWRRV